MGRSVRIYGVAGWPAGRCPHRPSMGLAPSAMLSVGHPHILGTYAFHEALDAWRPALAAIPGCDLLVDSGAYTAHTSGRVITRERYLEWMRESVFPVPCEFFTLDVIGDQAATWANHEWLRAKGANVIPIVTANGATAADVDRAAAEGFFAVGGLVGSGRARQRAVLDAIFARLMELPELPRVHLLGLASPWALHRYPAYSCDAASWISPMRHLQLDLPGLKHHRVSYSTGAPDAAAVALGLRHNARKIVRQQATATRLWEARGVSWT